jgi:hypothetical protein
MSKGMAAPTENGAADTVKLTISCHTSFSRETPF